jgi:hypothetical protein
VGVDNVLQQRKDAQRVAVDVHVGEEVRQGGVVVVIMAIVVIEATPFAALSSLEL